MAKKAFTEIFEIYPSGSISPKVKIDVNGVKFGPGVTFRSELIFGGVNFHKHIGEDIAVDITDDNVYVIKGFYK